VGDAVTARIAHDPGADEEVVDEEMRPAGQRADRMREQRHHTGQRAHPGVRIGLSEADRGGQEGQIDGAQDERDQGGVHEPLGPAPARRDGQQYPGRRDNRMQCQIDILIHRQLLLPPAP
jgi:hypothetical protein